MKGIRAFCCYSQQWGAASCCSDSDGCSVTQVVTSPCIQLSSTNNKLFQPKKNESSPTGGTLWNFSTFALNSLENGTAGNENQSIAICVHRCPPETIDRRRHKSMAFKGPKISKIHCGWSNQVKATIQTTSCSCVSQLFPYQVSSPHDQ